MKRYISSVSLRKKRSSKPYEWFTIREIRTISKGYCPDCGSLLPVEPDSGNTLVRIECTDCDSKFNVCRVSGLVLGLGKLVLGNRVV